MMGDVVPSQEVLSTAMVLANRLKPKGQGPARHAMHGIKCGVYKGVLEVLRWQRLFLL